ncbi:uncharacterized protein V1510DRAFT_418079 [Dipodascopsis tothii]|uniref:uncharacterized protein n=1 Tax=Dipodascopsis tothii TaxID=44089 RepID=UPI0034CF943A
MQTLLELTASNPASESRALAATIIGSALRNNYPALETSSSVEVVTKVLDRLEVEADTTVRQRLIFALASAIHGKNGRKEYLDHNGGSILRQLFASGDASTKARCGTFVEDSFANEDMNAYRSDDLNTKIQNELSAWAGLFQDSLSKNEVAAISSKEKIFSALATIRKNYPLCCPVKDNFRSWIAEAVDHRSRLIASGQNHDEMPDIEFLNQLSAVRHTLFGNPKAGRKAFDASHDEL